MNKNKLVAKAPNYIVKPSEHFLVKGLKNAFDYSAIVPIYLHVSNNIENITRNENTEFDIGRATIIYSVDDNSIIHLITGWVGNRKHNNALKL